MYPYSRNLQGVHTGVWATSLYRDTPKWAESRNYTGEPPC